MSQWNLQCLEPLFTLFDCLLLRFVYRYKISKLLHRDRNGVGSRISKWSKLKFEWIYYIRTLNYGKWDIKKWHVIRLKLQNCSSRPQLERLRKWPWGSSQNILVDLAVQNRKHSLSFHRKHPEKRLKHYSSEPSLQLNRQMHFKVQNVYTPVQSCIQWCKSLWYWIFQN